MGNSDELGKYQTELGEVNRRLQDLEDQKTKLVRLGVRLEGVIAYLNLKAAEAENGKGAVLTAAEPAAT